VYLRVRDGLCSCVCVCLCERPCVCTSKATPYPLIKRHTAIHKTIRFVFNLPVKTFTFSVDIFIFSKLILSLKLFFI
jgi:hypothetical protein